ncbi:TPA: DUF2095 domain-containing protein [Candidatus Bathyarchaeota archaeon]|nr:DUF2095 domain-containing protein [Candidatus Bathyarchaeota archaeon]
MYSNDIEFGTREGVGVAFSKKELRKLFPYLMDEIEKKKGTVRIRSVRTIAGRGERAVSYDRLRGYMPDVVDFIRRCDTEEEALEIIDFMERKGEITPAYAERLREQLKTRGLRSFGLKKERGYYFRIAGRPI